MIMCCFARTTPTLDGRMIIVGGQKESGEKSAALPFRAAKLTK
jgi:hypothetical protein